MRVSGMIAAAVVSLLSSSVLAAELPIVKQSHATWAGCTYRVVVRKDSAEHPYYPPETGLRIDLFRVSVYRYYSAQCAVPTAGVQELGTSHFEPNISIVASAQGLVVAFSQEPWDRWFPGQRRITVGQVDLSTLGFTRSDVLRGSNMPLEGGAGGPGAVELDKLIVHSGFVELRGALDG
ncbi:MAG: hypothetical protein ABW123_17180, partial [Cystobacter sp.]